jgi:hypothetical protein
MKYNLPCGGLQSSGLLHSEDFLPIKMGPISYPETSVSNYHKSLSNNAEERTSYKLREGNLKSRNVMLFAQKRMRNVRKVWLETLKG